LLITGRGRLPPAFFCGYRRVSGRRGTVRTARNVRVRDGLLAAATVFGFVLVASAIGRHQAGGTASVPSGGSLRRITDHSSQANGTRPRTGRSHLPIPWEVIRVLLEAGLLLALVGLAYLLLPLIPSLNLRRRRRRARQPVELAPDDLARQLRTTLTETLSGVEQGQVRDAVLLCWSRLEQTAEAAGFARHPSDTSTELAGRLLASLSLSTESLQRLGGLYRQARFSSHPIGPEAVAQARSDLGRLRAELETARPIPGSRHG
jgi:hypothetical protein